MVAGASEGASSLARSSIETKGAELLGLQAWAEIRAMREIQGAVDHGDREATGRSRNGPRAAAQLRAAEHGPRPRRRSKVDPFLPVICGPLEDEPTLSGVCVLEDIQAFGYCGGRRSSTTCCASSGPATGRRPGPFSAPSTVPASWPSLT
jgi:hypothetical protein